MESLTGFVALLEALFIHIAAPDPVSPCNARRLSARLLALALSATCNRGRYGSASAVHSERRTKDRATFPEAPIPIPHCADDASGPAWFLA
jgi:hypothetical protein